MTNDPNDPLPNFFVVGAPRSGTTLLYRALCNHPEVFMCPIKEPSYFSKDIDFEQLYPGLRLPDVKAFIASGMKSQLHLAHAKEWNDYVRLFSRASKARAIGECSTTYLASQCAAREIKSSIPDARIIILLRNPVERAFSDYLMHLNQGLMRRPFIEEALNGYADCAEWNLLGKSQYYQQVKRYFRVFDPARVKVILHEDLQKMDRAIDGVAGLLGLSAGMVPLSAAKVNGSMTLRMPKVNRFVQRSGAKRLLTAVLPKRAMISLKRLYYSSDPVRLDPADRAKLLELLKPDIVKLEDLIQRDLSAWRSSPEEEDRAEHHA
ncbi:MAG: sulfotransferase [Candidatus Binatus sp.]|uniref:sulfotransferase family protein n=1 Tax=Candidatus Binatus sp. TaxID=2811406 RepID=UPI0027177333|nr:sulfotransferase [Candidatus Binatus sp.]MDO8435046.1 sulfotransferase [Candidatus Binatus sp.]